MSFGRGVPKKMEKSELDNYMLIGDFEKKYGKLGVKKSSSRGKWGFHLTLAPIDCDEPDFMVRCRPTSKVGYSRKGEIKFQCIGGGVSKKSIMRGVRKCKAKMIVLPKENYYGKGGLQYCVSLENVKRFLKDRKTRIQIIGEHVCFNKAEKKPVSRKKKKKEKVVTRVTKKKRKREDEPIILDEETPLKKRKLD